MIVRPFNADHAATLLRWFYHPELKPYFRGYVHGPNLRDMWNAPKYLSAHLMLGISTEEDENVPLGTAVGMVSFADTDNILRIYRTGVLVDPQYQNSNFAKLTAIGAIQWAFETMNAHKIFGEYLERDKRLLRGLINAGFTVEGTKRQSTFFEGQYHNEVIVSMLQSDYKERVYGNK